MWLNCVRVCVVVVLGVLNILLVLFGCVWCVMERNLCVTGVLVCLCLGMVMRCVRGVYYYYCVVLEIVLKLILVLLEVCVVCLVC